MPHREFNAMMKFFTAADLFNFPLRAMISCRPVPERGALGYAAPNCHLRQLRRLVGATGAQATYIPPHVPLRYFNSLPLLEMQPQLCRNTIFISNFKRWVVDFFFISNMKYVMIPDITFQWLFWLHFRLEVGMAWVFSVDYFTILNPAGSVVEKKRKEKMFIQIKNIWYYNVYIHKLKLAIKYFHLNITVTSHAEKVSMFTRQISDTRLSILW